MELDKQLIKNVFEFCVNNLPEKKMTKIEIQDAIIKEYYSDNSVLGNVVEFHITLLGHDDFILLDENNYVVGLSLRGYEKFDQIKNQDISNWSVL